MGGSNKRRRPVLSRRHAALLGFLPYATLARAVALSDFSPRLISLSQSCQQVYTTQITGCTVADFTNSAHTCSSLCLTGLVRINGLVSRQCAQDDVVETSIVGLFKMGQAIQLLCNVAVVTTTPGVPASGGGGSGGIPSNTFNTFSSTMTMSQSTPPTSSILSQTQSPTSKSAPATSNGVIGNTPFQPAPPSTASSSSTATSRALQSSSPSSSSAATRSLSPAALESLRSGNVGGGGGSPFDNIDNSEAASLRSLGGVVTSILTVSVLAVVLNLR